MVMVPALYMKKVAVVVVETTYTCVAVVAKRIENIHSG
jgi:hypothetical protein